MIRRTMTIGLGLLLTGVSAAQRFEIVTTYPPDGSATKAKSSPGLSSVSPPPASNATPAKTAAKGFKFKSFVHYSKDKEGTIVVSEIPNLSTGEPSFYGVYQSKTLFLARLGGTLSAFDSRRNEDLYDNPMMRFVFLGTPIKTGQPTEVGAVAFQPNPFAEYLVEWNTKNGWQTITASQKTFGGGKRLVIYARVRPDRSVGILERRLSATRRIRTQFRKEPQGTQSLRFESVFPVGLTLEDYRGSRVKPITGTWDPMTPALIGGPGRYKAVKWVGLACSLVLLAGLGITWVYRQKNAHKPEAQDGYRGMRSPS